MYYDHSNVKFARKLRRDMTPWEKNYGLRVVYICNLDIDNNFYGVCTVIDGEVKNRCSYDDEIKI